MIIEKLFTFTFTNIITIDYLLTCKVKTSLSLSVNVVERHIYPM